MHSTHLRPLLVTLTASVLALSFAAGSAHAQATGQAPAQTTAQTTAPAPAAAMPAPPAAPQGATAPHHRSHMTLAERFDAANTTHDGHMTLDQARAGMPMVARHFAAMDKTNKGYVTLADIHAYLREQRAMRHQAQPNQSKG